jgi:putative FmdB family regulatory protein
MPLYEYECEQCGARFEIIQRFSDPPVETCKSCGGPVHKLISPPAIQFKGTGWYITDYAKKNGGSPSTHATSSNGDGKKSDTSSSSSSSSTTTTTSGTTSSDSGGKKD